ncbi:hypothetical protein ACJ41O_010654 [Fusarium nematophilum]
MGIRAMISALCLASAIAHALGHMQLSNPPPLRSKFNRYTGSDIDYSMTSPLRADGFDFPCKGYHNLLQTPMGTPVAMLRGGETYIMTVTGEAFHEGGSCQASLSVDNGKTFRVLHTYIGNCPAKPGDSALSFRVPADVPFQDRALFAWSWFNKLGNREMYMNCASVTTKPGPPGGVGGGFLTRPGLFVANVGNGCKTAESRDVLIPDPGPEVTVNNPEAVPPVGKCGAGGGPGGKAPGLAENGTLTDDFKNHTDSVGRRPWVHVPADRIRPNNTMMRDACMRRCDRLGRLDL